MVQIKRVKAEDLRKMTFVLLGERLTELNLSLISGKALDSLRTVTTR